ncbi:MAG: hypothetical protein CL857_00100 [Cryomorphaceae bacterium]|mgnify:FL=1|nr:hypothetical protein [Cryomorphaceae bacterium]|tara:strand:- start:2655 stop:3704 length:1050 start_codon:yes stop_codon:yes gene_type:complete
MKRKTKLILLVGLVGFFYTCTKEDFEGPSINNLYGNFEIIEPLTLTNDNPNFESNEQVGFHCKLNKPVEWKITIHGLTTSASREITGFSSQIDSNTVVWNGGPAQVPFFSEEFCSVELSFENEIDTLRDTINIASAKTYEDGIWFEDFEDGLPTEGLVYYNTDGGGMTFSVANDGALLGNSYFKMGGRVNWDWVLGSLDLPLNITNVSQAPDDLFINIGLLSDLDDLHTGQFINILISEETNTPFNDNLDNNASDLFESTMEVYKMKIPVDWNGWQLKSFRYSDFEPRDPNNPDIVFDMNPNNIRAIRIACQACPSSSGNPVCPENFGKDVRTDIDHIIFTANAALLDQ